MTKLRRRAPEKRPAGAFGRHAAPARASVERDDRAREEGRIRDILSAEYSYAKIQVIAANMRREMERRAEIEEIFGELNGYERYEAACFQQSLKRRERARFARAELRQSPALYREFRERQNEWRRGRSPEAKARDKRLKAAWAKSNAARLNKRRKERDALMRVERPDEYRARARARSERARSRPHRRQQLSDAQKRYQAKVKADPARYERQLERHRETKRGWYERNAEYAREQERARRRGPSGTKVRARDRARYQAQRADRRAAAKTRHEANLEEARRKRRDWYRRNQKRELARTKAAQSSPARRAAKQEYDRARYAAGIGRQAA